MAKNDGEVNIGVNFKTDKVAKGIDGLKDKLSRLTGANIFKSIMGLGAAFIGVKTAISLTTKTIKETTEAYRVQTKAEKQLEVAAKNNPYLDKKSVNELKAYASQLQSISTIGDEQLLPLMSQLASSGRTQEEIQNILSAALDVSASGMMSLDSAVMQLNASFSGNVGQMSSQIAELKDLTAEELKNGKAVEIIAQKYKGMAAETAATTGTSEQLKNAWGDLKEELGYGFEKALTPVRKYFTKLVSDIADAKRKLREEREGVENYDAGVKETATIEAKISATERSLKADELSLNNIEKMNAAQRKRAGITDAHIKQIKENIELKQTQLEQEREELKLAQEEEKAKQQAAEQAAKEAASQEERNKKNKDALDFMNANKAALEKNLQQIRLEAELKGEEADAQDILNAYIQSYIDLVTGSDLVTENNPYSKKRLQELQQYAAEVQQLNIDTKDLEESIKEFLNPDEDTKLSDTIQATIDQLTEERAALDENSKAWKAYTDKIAELEGLKTDVIAKEEEAAKQTAIENAAALVENIATYINQFSDIVNSITDIAKSNNEAQTNDALTSLSEQYNDGLIDYETYCEKKGEINKKAALEEYKINMWAWNASLLTAAANIATGVASCLAEQGIPTALKYVNMALVAASGAAQVASIIANKPQRPSFYTGGVVGGINGTSYGADNTTINARKGEMILNANQQSKLWSMLNSGSSGGVSLNVDVVNNMGDSANVNTQLTSDGLRVTIDRIVESSLQKGRYNASLQTAENQRKGVNYL